MSDANRRLVSQVLFWTFGCVCLIPLVPGSKPVLAFVAPCALVLGCLLALTVGNPYAAEAKKVSRTLLQAAVVMLGFSMDFAKVFAEGKRGLVFAIISISCVFALGYVLQRLLKVRPLTSLLVSTGTAICGGSAIAAMSSVTDAPQEDVSVAVGTVFLLNAIGLVIFPPLGHAFGLTAQQFGIWSGIAIHDVSSVVGAATSWHDPAALETAVAVKLSRVLYLVPMTLIVAYFWNRRNGVTKSTKPQIPWFIGLFVLASLVNSYVGPVREQGPNIKIVATVGFAASLFLIGSGLSRKTLKEVGVRPLLQGVILWLFMAVTTLIVVRAS